MEILGPKIQQPKFLNGLDELKSRLKKREVGELEYKTMQIIQSEEQREKELEKIMSLRNL